MTLGRIACLAAAAATLAACAHGGSLPPPDTLELDVRPVGGRARSFDFDLREEKLTAYSSSGKLLELWMNPGELIAGNTRRTIARGCRGGFLHRHSVPEGTAVSVLVQLCPRDDAPPGWQGWHAEFELSYNDDAHGTLPPKADFAIALQPGGAGLRVASPNLHAEVALPAGRAAEPLGAYPEIVAFSIISGIVPAGVSSRYEVVAP